MLPAGRLLLRAATAVALPAGLLVAGAAPALAAGTQDLFAPAVGGSRAVTEWRTSTYGGGAVFRRTLIHAYATAGEYLLLGSTGVGVASGDILVWNPGLITGTTGLETVPATASYSCAAQRLASGIAAQGRITSRAAELAGPDTVPGGGVAGGYSPCWYHVPVSGIYGIVMVGPAGFSSNAEPNVAADLALASVHDFDATQATAVAAWDVTVRDSLTSAVSHPGRVFTDVFSLFAGGNGQPINMSTYPVTPDGFRYKVDDRGLDPAGWIQYGTQLGFLDSDGRTPLYHDALATNAGQPQQLTSIQGGIVFARPQFPMFLEPPDNAALTALGIPLTSAPPGLSGLSFVGSRAGRAVYKAGGTFSYLGSAAAVYEIIISRDGINFDPTAQQNRALRGLRGAGAASVTWDGKDNSGAYFPVGANYHYRVSLHAGEYHLPFVDVENDIHGGPTITLLNPPGGVCPPLTGGCSGGFYDDRGYTTSAGQTVGTPGTVLCGGSPPAIAFSDPVTGFDTRSTQHAFGTASGGNSNVPCTGSFGDTKGLDVWTYYPSTPLTGALDVVDAAAEVPTPDVGAGTVAPLALALILSGAGVTVAGRRGRRGPSA